MVKSSAGRLFGRSAIYGSDGEIYMVRYWLGRLRLHVFHRGDQDPDCHDHPWDFWTFPFVSYVEEVVDPVTKERSRQIVHAWCWSYRPAEHTHRVLGAWDEDWQHPEMTSRWRGHEFVVTGSVAVPSPRVDWGRRVTTLVWRGRPRREWGFLKNRLGEWCWVPWRKYVFGGGRSAPCE